MANYLDDAEITAQGIMALDDAQLDQYLNDNGRLVAVKDPDHLDEVFIQRLRARTLDPKSMAVDPLKLTARLLDAPTYEERPTRFSSPATSTTSSTMSFGGEDYDQYSKRLEIEAYHDLVNSGGRPSHPVERMEEIVSDPGEFREILSFWQENATDWEVFSRQEVRWLNFRRIQRVAREGHFKEDSHLLMAAGRDTWDEFAREFPSYTNGTRGFLEYVRSAKERLARNGFTRSFELERDIAEQDKLATWIEFMNWEYMWYERYVSWERRGQGRHDKAWKALVHSGELRPGETEEELWMLEHSLQCSSEESSAERAMKSAKDDLRLAKHAIASSRTPVMPIQECQRRIAAAEAKLVLAENTHKRLARRNDCISRYINTTKNYRIAKEDAARHLILLRWMLQQIPLIEREGDASMEASPAYQSTDDAALPNPVVGGTDSGIMLTSLTSCPHECLVGTSHSSGPASPPSRGGKRSRDESGNYAQPSKKTKHGNGTTARALACNVTSLNDQRGTTAASRPVPVAQPSDKRKRHTQGTFDAKDAGHQQASHRAKPRRSARIAEQQNSIRV